MSQSSLDNSNRSLNSFPESQNSKSPAAVLRSISPEAPHKTHPRMLRNLKGEKVYIGGAASLSFLQFIRETVVQYTGPSGFTHNAKIDSMLETASAVAETVPYDENNLTLEGRLSLLNSYRLATSGILDIISVSDAMDLLAETSTADTPANRSKAAVADLILAIGAQCPKVNTDITYAEKFFFTRGQKRAFAGMLEDPNLELVWAFLLMAFYMLGACRRNAGFMYLGVATRAAVALGLHNENSYAYLSSIDTQKRIGTWMSLCILDLLVSSILGRPSATVSLRAEIGRSLILKEHREDSTRAQLYASYALADMMETIGRELYGQKAVATSAAEQFLQRLGDWSKELPETMRTASSNLDTPEGQEFTLGSIQVVCFYYFASMLVTRPFLISTLTARLVRSRQGDLSESATPSVYEDPIHIRLASACVDSAEYLIQACQDAQKAGLLLANMCIMKAIVFAAALVLGFSMFAKNKPDSEVEAAFDGAKEILELFSLQSAQAAHYFEILTLLSNAINEQRQRLASQPRRSKSAYIGRIFSLDGPETGHQYAERGTAASANTGLNENPFPSALVDLDSNEGTDISDFWSTSTFPLPIPSQSADEEAFMGWDSLHLPVWDNFPFVENPFISKTD